MRCHICNEPAVGQCTACWRFYCADHGDGRCDNCAGQGREQMPGDFARKPAAIGGDGAAADAGGATGDAEARGEK